MKRCHAHSKQTGLPCKQPVTPGREVCRFHGGGQKRGPAHHSYQDGRHSKALPRHLLAAYATSRADPDLLALRDELALCDARLTDLLAQGPPPAPAWAALAQAWAHLEAARAAGNQVGVARWMGQVRTLIQEGAALPQPWEEVYGLLELRRRLVETERKRLEALQATITAEEAITLVGAIAASVKQHVHDPAALQAISADVLRLLPLAPSDARPA